MTILAAMGIDREGRKHMLSITEGGSENSEVAKGLQSRHGRIWQRSTHLALPSSQETQCFIVPTEIRASKYLKGLNHGIKRV